MRFDIRYLTCFSYPEAVRESHNVLRACPMTDARQEMLSYRVSTTPAARVFSYVDYWGTRVDVFGVAVPHTRLEVSVETTVQTRDTGPLTACPRLASLRDTEFLAEHQEYLEASPHTAWREPLRRDAEIRAVNAGDDVVGAVLALHRAAATSLTYMPGSTYVGMDVNEVFARKSGVCQDYAHLMVAMCRSVGIPARYVSGYLPTALTPRGQAPDPNAAEVTTHAWVEVAIPGAGWWGLDPTNQQEVSASHVKIAHGRDYDDVAPLRGIYHGPAAHRLDVSVKIAPQNGAQQQYQNGRHMPAARKPSERLASMQRKQQSQQ
ncbi:MAG: transglutaminase family protein [Candidatus Binatia bacterium]